jgi:uncharacterized protein YceK
MRRLLLLLVIAIGPAALAGCGAIGSSEENASKEGASNKTPRPRR